MNSVTEKIENKELIDISKEMEELRDRFHAVTEKFRMVRVSPIIRESHIQRANRPVSMELSVYRFISENPEIETLLPVFEENLKHFFSQDTSYQLELLDEGNDWKTLFITAQVDATYKKINEFYDHFMELLLNKFPEVFNIVNLDLRPK